MSDFVRQNGSSCDFGTSDSWVILSPIELSIKRKIEAAGTPLKDWDINIYRGVLTGCNEAFIINREKRDEILQNCETDDERERTAELIRPILRGRDIKRYGYEWAGLYLIATFPSRHYDIDDYPAVKGYLLSFAEDKLLECGYNWVVENYLSDFCLQKLSQTGQFVEINGQRIRLGNTDEKARKRTNNKWFETQDSISYWEDFDKPKMVYPETTQGAYFVYDNSCMMIDKTCFMLISQHAQYLQQTLSSKLFEYAYKHFFSSVALGEHGYQYNKHALLKLPVLVPNQSDINITDNEIFKMYNLTEPEKDFILSQYTQ